MTKAPPTASNLAARNVMTLSGLLLLNQPAGLV
jgi:hypothetical protein